MTELPQKGQTICDKKTGLSYVFIGVCKDPMYWDVLGTIKFRFKGDFTLTREES